MKKSSPASLYDDAVQREQDRHADRLKSLTRLRARLQMLNAHMPAITTAGLEICPEDLEEMGGVLRVNAQRLFFSNYNGRLAEVLIAQGFRSEVKTDHGTWQTLHLKKGRLTLSISVNKPAPAEGQA